MTQTKQSAAKRWAVYDVRVDGVLFYVGKSHNPRNRLRSHKRAGNVPRHATVHIVAWYETSSDALAAETLRIKHTQPPGNILVRIKRDPRDGKPRRDIRKTVAALNDAERQRQLAKMKAMEAEAQEWLETPEGVEWELRSRVGSGCIRRPFTTGS